MHAVIILIFIERPIRSAVFQNNYAGIQELLKEIAEAEAEAEKDDSQMSLGQNGEHAYGMYTV